MDKINFPIIYQKPLINIKLIRVMVRRKDVERIKLLLLLFRNETDLTMGKIRRIFDIKKSTLSNYLNEMIRLGILRKSLTRPYKFNINCSGKALREILKVFDNDIGGYFALMNSKYGNEVVDWLYDSLQRIASQDATWKVATNLLNSLNIIVTPKTERATESDAEFVRKEIKAKIRERAREAVKKGYPLRIILNCIRHSPESMQFLLDVLEGKGREFFEKYLEIGEEVMSFRNPRIGETEKITLHPNLFNTKPSNSVEHTFNYFLIFLVLCGINREQMEIRWLKSTGYWHALSAPFLELRAELTEKVYEGDFAENVRQSLDISISATEYPLHEKYAFSIKIQDGEITFDPAIQKLIKEDEELAKALNECLKKLGIPSLKI
ncbi:hypothetical protein DRP07_10360 [Archaeoglobales archaeon]|nr:MAG: hypothetical protein DRP07_10360 [Archaeoglobales archaeon]